MNRFLTALFLIFSCELALAQGTGTVPAGSIAIGRGPTSTGWASLPPGANGNCVQVAGGAFVSNPCPGGISSITAGSQMTLTPNPITSTGTVALSQGGANTFKGSLNGSTTSDLALTACTLTYNITKWVAGTGWACGLNPVLPSRATAATLDLSAFTTVTTQGYARPGDGGHANFYRRNGAILTFTISNAGSCNNGTWIGIRLTGGTGQGATGTLTVAGGVATNFSLHGAGAQGIRYSVNDVLTVSNAGNVVCTTYPTIVVNTIGNAPFIDAAVTAVTTNNVGAGCTNNTYYGVTPQSTVVNGGGFGDRLQGNATIAGGQLTAFTINVPGGGYKVGDLLNFVNPNASAQIPGCATQPVLAVSTVAAPLGSFTDSGGTNWQIEPNEYTSVLQFGAAADYQWLQPDGDATDNGPAFRAALTFTAVGNGPADAHGYGGGRLNIPRGGYLICGGIVQYEYVTMQGAAQGGSMLKQCNSDSAAASLLTQGDSLSRLGNFAVQTWDLTLYGSTNGTGPVVFSNNSQSGDALVRVAIYANSTNGTCAKYVIGYGGQSQYGIHSVLCVLLSGSPGFDLSGNFNFSFTGETAIAGIIGVSKAVRVGDGGTAYFAPGFHVEGSVTNGISVNGSGSSPPQVTVMGGIGPATNGFIYIETGTPANYTTVINTNSNGSGCLVYMQATASCAKAGSQLGVATY